VARAVLDSASILSRQRLVYAIEQAVRLNVFNLDALERAMARRSKAKGIAVLRQILADFREPALTRSDLERLFLELIRRAGLPEPLCNAYVAGEQVDFYWPQWRLVV
jgi:hypothetical protein